MTEAVVDLIESPTGSVTPLYGEMLLNFTLEDAELAADIWNNVCDQKPFARDAFDDRGGIYDVQSLISQLGLTYRRAMDALSRIRDRRMFIKGFGRKTQDGQIAYCVFEELTGQTSCTIPELRKVADQLSQLGPQEKLLLIHYSCMATTYLPVDVAIPSVQIALEVFFDTHAFMKNLAGAEHAKAFEKRWCINPGATKYMRYLRASQITKLILHCPDFSDDLKTRLVEVITTRMARVDWDNL